jgi:hypothetical protein
MTLSAAGFPGSVTDIQWSRLIDLLGYDGTDGMSVSVTSGDRTVVVNSGVSNVGGILAVNDAPVAVGPLPANAGSQTRIDRIILRANWSNKTLTATYRQGTPSASPVPPTITRNPGSLYEVRLAQVVVAPGTGNLSSGDVLAERVPPVAGFYNTSSFRTFPDPDVGSLVWYGAANSLRVPIDGEYVEIANARSEMVATHASQSGTQLLSSGNQSFGPGTPTCGLTFVAPPSGRVIITLSGVVESTQNGSLTILSFRVGTGSTLGGGSAIFGPSDEYAITAGRAVNQGAATRTSGSMRRLITGLSAGSTYNVRTMQRVDAGETGGIGGAIFNRYLLVEYV